MQLRVKMTCACKSGDNWLPYLSDSLFDRNALVGSQVIDKGVENDTVWHRPK